MDRFFLATRKPLPVGRKLGPCEDEVRDKTVIKIDHQSKVAHDCRENIISASYGHRCIKEPEGLKSILQVEDNN